MISLSTPGARTVRCDTCGRVDRFTPAAPDVLDAWTFVGPRRECPRCTAYREAREAEAAEDAAFIARTPELPFTLGAIIGKGNRKDVYEAGPDVVVRILRGRRRLELVEEHASLQKLEAAGFPVPRILALGRAGISSADALERFTACTQAPPVPADLVATAQDDLQRIRNSLDALAIGDLQVLVKPGRAAVIDPGQLFEPGEQGFEAVRDYGRTIVDGLLGRAAA